MIIFIFSVDSSQPNFPFFQHRKPFLKYNYKSMVNIFEYFDYRKFLRDYYEFRKGQNPNYSHRYVGLKVGISPSTFNKVIKKKRNLSLRLAVKISEVFKFSKKEKDYLLWAQKMGFDFSFPLNTIKS